MEDGKSKTENMQVIHELASDKEGTTAEVILVHMRGTARLALEG
jgi:hypothetical protein